MGRPCAAPFKAAQGDARALKKVGSAVTPVLGSRIKIGVTIVKVLKICTDPTFGATKLGVKIWPRFWGHVAPIAVSRLALRAAWNMRQKTLARRTSLPTTRIMLQQKNGGQKLTPLFDHLC